MKIFFCPDCDRRMTYTIIPVVHGDGSEEIVAGERRVFICPHCGNSELPPNGLSTSRTERVLRLRYGASKLAVYEYENDY